MPDLTTDYWRFIALKESYPGPAATLEISASWREQLPTRVSESGRLLQEALSSAKSILDVGAGNRLYQNVFRDLGITGDYYSADLDTSFDHDYRDFLKIENRRFDAITMFELIEHMDVADGLRFMEHALTLLSPNGRLVISTPNAHHPNHVWRVEVTHVRPWPAPDLYGALRLVGFPDVVIYRQYIRLTGPKAIALEPVRKGLYRLMGLDYAQGIFAIAASRNH